MEMCKELEFVSIIKIIFMGQLASSIWMTWKHIVSIASGWSDLIFNVVFLFMSCRKYEEICAPRVEEFCFITDNTYSREEVRQSSKAMRVLK